MFRRKLAISVMESLLEVHGKMLTLKTVFLDTPRLFKKGDIIMNECIFNTSWSNSTIISMVIKIIFLSLHQEKVLFHKSIDNLIEVFLNIHLDGL